jgi:predicted nucleic acid-binding protein
MAERRKRLSAADSRRIVGLLARLPIEVDVEMPNHVFTSVLALAREQHLSAYDASYLELALRLGLPLASLDTRLRRAAMALGVPQV